MVFDMPATSQQSSFGVLVVFVASQLVRHLCLHRLSTLCTCKGPFTPTLSARTLPLHALYVTHTLHPDLRPTSSSPPLILSFAPPSDLTYHPSHSSHPKRHTQQKQKQKQKRHLLFPLFLFFLLPSSSRSSSSSSSHLNPRLCLSSTNNLPFLPLSPSLSPTLTPNPNLHIRHLPLAPPCRTSTFSQTATVSTASLARAPTESSPRPKMSSRVTRSPSSASNVY